MALHPRREGLAALEPPGPASADTMKRIAFTLGALVVWRIGCFVPLPGVDVALFGRLLGSPTMGEAVARVSIFSLGVLPYVTAFVIVHALCGFFARLRDLRNGGEHSRKRFNQIIRLVAVGIALFQSYGMADALEGVRDLVPEPGFSFRVGTVASLVAGTIFLIWLGEQISARGLGNGVWLIFAAGYIAHVPAAVFGVAGIVSSGALPAWIVVAGAALTVALVALIVAIQGATRALPVQYPPETLGRPAGKRVPCLLLRIDYTGVLVPLLAPVLLGVLVALAHFMVPDTAASASSLWRLVVYAAIIILLTYYFTAALIDGRWLARDLDREGGTLSGAGGSGEAGAQIDGVLSRLTHIAVIYLLALCLVPQVLTLFTPIPFYLGGAPLLITVLAALEVIAGLYGPRDAEG